MLGNLVGGPAFVGLILYATHARTGATRRPADATPVDATPVEPVPAPRETETVAVG